MTEWYINNNRIRKYIADYPQLQPLYENPSGEWIAGRGHKPLKNVKSHVERLLNRAGDSVVTLVIYRIPNRDLGSHSRGGSQTEKDYLSFIDDLCEGIGDSAPIIVFEPDALAHMLTHLSTPAKIKREQLIKRALKRLSKTNSKVYIDVGHCNWLSPEIVAKKLLIFKDYITGFCSNTSNYYPTEQCIEYSKEINGHLPEPLPYVIDTSRNGNPNFDGTWCNPPGRRLGLSPTLDTGTTKCDAFLWIKVPGESDGRCQGGPGAGVFWLDQALELCNSK